MLNYLRNPNEELPAEQETNAVPQEEKDCLTVATKGKDVRRSTTILGVLFIIGLVCLGIMIKKSSPQTAAANTKSSTEELQLEVAIAKLTGIKSEMFNRMDEIVNKFYEFSDVFQVQVGELMKNPFQLESFIKQMNINPDERPSINVEMMVREQIKLRAKDIKLYSTMESEKGACCMINNKILYEGDSINDFMVKKISKDSVVLEMESVEITLRMSR